MSEKPQPPGIPASIYLRQEKQAKPEEKQELEPPKKPNIVVVPPVQSVSEEKHSTPKDHTKELDNAEQMLRQLSDQGADISVQSKEN